jgi:hypothetical protein
MLFSNHVIARLFTQAGALQHSPFRYAIRTRFAKLGSFDHWLVALNKAVFLNHEKLELAHCRFKRIFICDQGFYEMFV